MSNVQSILREIVSDLENLRAGLIVVSSDLQKVSPRSGYETKEALNQAFQVNRQFYEGLLKKIDELT